MTVASVQESLDLPLDALIRDDPYAGESTQEAFERFHRDNPWVLTALERLTETYLSRGHHRVGIGMLTEVLRYQYDVATTGDAFRLNNNYRSRYVRLMIQRNPSWSDRFETRELKA